MKSRRSHYVVVVVTVVLSTILTALSSAFVIPVRDTAAVATNAASIVHSFGIGGIARRPRPISSSSTTTIRNPVVLTWKRSFTQLQRASASSSDGSSNTSNTKTTTTTSSSSKARKTKESERLIDIKPTIKLGKDWEIYMEELIIYNQTHGTVNVPRTSSKEYPLLASVVCNIRKHQGRLTQGQMDTLSSLGFIWKDVQKVKDQQKWLVMYERLKDYKNEFGDCKVPRNYTDNQNPSLGNWVKKQRHKYRQKILETDRVALLNAIGFVWRTGAGCGGKPNDKLWQQRFQELMDFKLEYNHTNVPTTYKDNISLAMWVHAQRNLFSQNLLGDNRRQQLEEIGFVWNFDDIRDSVWQQHFEELKLHIQKHGSGAPVPDDYLSHWAKDLRLYKEKGTLDKRRKAKLVKIGFKWDPKYSLNKSEDLVRNKEDSSSTNGTNKG